MHLQAHLTQLSRFQDAGSKESHTGCGADPVPFKGETWEAHTLPTEGGFS